jgi:hypothetical protein
VYLQELDDDLYGFSEVSPRQLLDHIRDNFSTLTDNDIETNRNELQAAWDPDDPIETLWVRIKEIQAIARRGGEPITNATVIRLTILMFEENGLFEHDLERWRDRDAAEQTYPQFRTFFTAANVERVRKLTAKSAGFHGANTAGEVPPADQRGTGVAVTPGTAETPPPPPPGDASAHAAVLPPGAINTNNGAIMYYCWTHGLGKNPGHTSSTCQNRADGHIATATADNMQGGNNTIFAGRPRRLPTAPGS